MRKSSLGILFILSFFSVQAQISSIVDGRARKLFEEGNQLTLSRQYDQAIEKYQEAIAREESFFEAYLKISQLLMTQGKLEQSEKNALLGKNQLQAKNMSPIFERDFAWLFTNLYFKQGRYLDAIDSFGLVKNLAEDQFKKSAYYIDMARQIDFLKTQIAYVKSVKKEQLDSPLNEFQLQYFPVLTADGEQILFTRREGIGTTSKEDIYTAYLDSAGQWSRPESISQTINSSYNEGTCSVTADGNVLIYTSCDAPDSYGGCDLFISRKKNGIWQLPKNMGNKVNSTSWDSQPSLSADGRILFFSSNRKGGIGGNDIWYSILQVDQSWSEAKNLGPVINTNKDEISPFMFFNNELLFFASNGHLGFGGMDIFMSRVADGEFQKPENLGLPINDQLDQVGLFITAQKDYAYYTELVTNLDVPDRSLLFRFRFPEEISLGDNLLVTQGKVLNSKTGEPLEAKLSLISLANDSTLYEFDSDGRTGEFLMLYPETSVSGLYVEKQGFLPKIYNVLRDSIRNVKDLRIEMVPINVGEKFVFENIFFDFDSSELKIESLSSLKKLSKFLRENPQVTILVSGHTDHVGSPSYNFQLSLLRAKSVQAFLINEGFDIGRVDVIGRGDQDPLVPNTTTQNQALNRRITVTVLKSK